MMTKVIPVLSSYMHISPSLSIDDMSSHAEVRLAVGPGDVLDDYGRAATLSGRGEKGRCMFMNHDNAFHLGHHPRFVIRGMHSTGGDVRCSREPQDTLRISHQLCKENHARNPVGILGVHGSSRPTERSRIYLVRVFISAYSYTAWMGDGFAMLTCDFEDPQSRRVMCEGGKRVGICPPARCTGQYRTDKG